LGSTDGSQGQEPSGDLSGLRLGYGVKTHAVLLVWRRSLAARSLYVPSLGLATMPERGLTADRLASGCKCDLDEAALESGGTS